MLENNNLRFGSSENRPEGYPSAESVTPKPPVQPGVQGGMQQAAPGSSYYSPRGAYPAGGGYVPPTNNPYRSAAPEGGDVPPKRKKQHKGLRALGVFAGIAFLSYASIQCYQFATENDSIRRFLGKDSSVAEERLSLQTSDASNDSSESTETSAASTADSTESSLVSTNWIDLAAREGAMSIPDIVDKVAPATVGVASTFLYEGQTYSMWGYGQTTQQDVSATGTGIIMSEEGYIITNAHVIYDSSSQYQMGLAKDVQIVLNEDYYSGDTQLEATIVGYDVAADIAVLKVDTDQKLTVAEFGDSDQLRVGELVIAIGNPLGFDLFGSVTTGIVSALNRELTINDSTMNLIQTDAAINSGNSGGPLINSYGQVIGINSSKMSSSYSADEASVEGLCFAIPISEAKSVINDLINYGYVTGKPLIGISGKNVTEEISQAWGIPVGVYVQEVSKGGAADMAGIQVGDIIIAVNGETISDYDELNAAKDQFKAGDQITLTVTRQGRDLDITLTLQEKKND